MWVQTSFFIINMENNWINNEILVFAILMNKILRFIFKNQILKIFCFILLNTSSYHLVAVRNGKFISNNTRAIGNV